MKMKMKVKRRIYDKGNYNIVLAGISNVELGEDELRHERAIQKDMKVEGEFIDCAIGDEYDAECKIILNDRGILLSLTKTQLLKVQGEDEIIKFFERKVEGVGKKIAEQIVTKLGNKAIDKIAHENGCDTLRRAKIKGLSEKKIKTIRESVLKHQNFAEILKFLEDNKLDVKMANQLYQEFGGDTLLDLKTNPYKFAGYIDFYSLDDAGYVAGMNEYSMQRIEAGIKGYIEMKLDTKGDVYVSRQELEEKLHEFLNKSTNHKKVRADLEALIKQALLQIGYEGKKIETERGTVTIEDNSIGFQAKGLVVVDEDRIYRKDLYYLEKNIASRLKVLNSQNIIYDRELTDTLIEIEQAKNGFMLAEKQKEAVHKAIKNDFFVLTGLPGAGKTSTTNIILKIYKRMYQEMFNEPSQVLLMAPTGKASRRLSELCNAPAQTIHRALNIGLFGGSDSSDKIDADFIVVDESSMVDIHMFYTLLERVKSGTKIMLVGDDEQLPSIGAGLILRDLINAENIASTKLTEVFRQSLESQIVLNSHKIIKSEIKVAEDFSFGKDVFFTNSSLDYNKMFSLITAHYKRMLQLGDKRECCILSPTRKGLFGTETLNKIIQEINPNEAILVGKSRKLKVGDMMMQNINNYNMINTKERKQVEVVNGEVGEIIDITTRMDEKNKEYKVVKIQYDTNKVVEYYKELLQEIELAYCITIHKSQGSEYKNVIMLICSDHKNSLTKNLVYTGMTRAKERLSLIGQIDALVASADKSTEISRKSYLKERIEG